MKVQTSTVRKILIALVAGVGLAAAAIPSFADSATDNPTVGGGYGPGMMGGYGPGYGPGYGAAARGGYGPGYGMGYGMGPGMMGGYAPGYGMGYGMGPWMMGGYGRGYGMGYGMGPWMSGGCGYGHNALDLSDAQRAKIQNIQEEAWKSQWEVMNKMHEAISQGWVEAQKKIDAVLTKKQREQLRQGWGPQQ